jgi:hypothetical protein
MKISVFTLPFLLRLAHVSAHSTKVAHCQRPDGSLRVFVEHWHGDGGARSGDKMQLNVDGTDVYLAAQGNVNNVNAANLPGCAEGSVPSVPSTCGTSYNYKDWGYWDFKASDVKGVCDDIVTALTVKLVRGTTVVFREACTNLFPVTLTLNTTAFCAPTAAPTPATTPAPTQAPSGQPSNSPSSAPSYESVSHGLCENFAVHARTTVTFDGVMTTISDGDVSVSPGTSITGDYRIDGGEIVADSSDFAASVLAAHDAAMETRPDAKPMDIEIGGRTFTPGTYHSGSAINFAHGTVVTLDGNDDPHPVFLFQAESTLVTAADTSFVLINGAKAENVLWVLGTAATLGARSVVEGSILAGTAITFGTKSELRGCALAQSAVTFESEGTVNLMHYIDQAGLARYLRGGY